MSILEVAIRVVAPPQCIGCGQEGAAICTACSVAEIIPYGERCWNCSAMTESCRTCSRCSHLGGPRYVWVSTDYSGLARELVKTYKFGHQRAAASALMKLMSETLYEQTAAEELKSRNYLVVPIPTATSRIRERSFDHSSLLARSIAKRLKLEYSPALRRLGQNRQVGAGRQLRLQRPVGEYLLRFPAKVSGRNVLLVDDVVTTGGTIIAATKALRAGGAKHVDALVYAKRL